MDQHTRLRAGSRSRAGVVDQAVARAVVRGAILDLRPLVTQSREGLTLVVLGRKARRPAARPSAAGRPRPHRVSSAGAAADLMLESLIAPRVADRATFVAPEVDGADLAAVTSAFVLPPAAVAVAVGLYDRIVSIDAFDDPAVLASAWPRVVAAAANAWLDRRRAIAGRLVVAPMRDHPDDGAVGRLLRRAVVAVDDAAARPSAGAGTDVRLVGDRVHGTALVVHGRAVHVSLFRRERPESPERLVL